MHQEIIDGLGRLFRSGFQGLRRRRNRRQHQQQNTALARPQVEPLEPRRLLTTTYNVDTFLDVPVNLGVAPLSLREAVIKSNTDGDDSVIQLGAGTYTLSIGFPDEDAAYEGDLDVTDVDYPTTIQGVGAGSTFIDADGIDRVIHVPYLGTFPSADLTINDVTISGGDATLDSFIPMGGGILNDGGTLTLSRSTVSGNTAYNGGGIYAYYGSTTNILESTISSNTANDPFGPSKGGGLFDLFGNFTIRDSTISGNVAEGGEDYYGRGGGIYADGSAYSVNVTNTVISGNQALGGINVSGAGGGAQGGGIYSIGVSWDTFTDNRVIGNSAIGGAGLDAVNGGDACGGGIFSTVDTVISFGENTIAGNQAIGGKGGDSAVAGQSGGNGGLGRGAGICSDDSTWDLVGYTAISGNLATGGAGGAAAADGSGGDAEGAGIYTLNSTWHDLQNSTLSGNIATGGAAGDVTSGSGNGGDAWGGGMYARQGTLIMLHATVANNEANGGTGGASGGSDGAGTGGGLVFDGTSSSTVDLQNTIVAGNMASTASPDVHEVSNAFSSSDYNLIGDGTGSTGFTGANDQVGTGASPVDPLLGPLQDNGGPTESHALLVGSPALDAATLVLLDDQRFATRPVDADSSADPDIGAFEATPAVVHIEKSTNGIDADTAPEGLDLLVGTTATFTYEVANQSVAPLAGVNVTDNQPVTPMFVSGDTDGDNLLDSDETWIYAANKTVTAGQYGNTGTATSDDNTGSFGPIPTTVSDIDLSHHFGADPNVSINKTTNGADGHDILTGTAITWTYEITNTGNVDLDTNAGDTVTVTDSEPGVNLVFVSGDAGSDGILGVMETWIYEATGTALPGPYTNTGTVEMDYVDDEGNVGEKSANDSSSYFGAEPDISIVKTTNGSDGREILTGSAVTWTYQVTNTGNVALDTNTGDTVTVTDDQGVIPVFDSGSDVGSDGVLSVGEGWTYTAAGTAVADAYNNVGRVDISYRDDLSATRTDFATDPSSYFGADPDISIVKTTNGDDGLEILTGAAITWTYQVTNTGNVALDVNAGDTITVTDDQGVIPVFVPSSDAGGDGVLSVGETWTYMAAGTSLAGPYANVGTVDIRYTDDAGGARLDSANDSSSYFGADPAIDIQKATNGDDADSPTGPLLPVGSTAVFTYTVTNPGNVPLDNVSVTDNQPVTVTFVGGDGNNNNLLDTDETWEYTASTIVTPGQYMNTGTLAADYADDVGGLRPVTDNDASHHVGFVQNPGLSVFDDCFDLLFTYTVGGGFLAEAGLRTANADVRGAAADSLGNTLWVLDLDKNIYVYQADGTPLGSWRANFAGNQPEGIAADGEDIWIVDRSRARVYFFDNAAGRTSGTFPPDASFPLQPKNQHPKGITTDGSHLWVVDDHPPGGDNDGSGGLESDSDEGDDGSFTDGGSDRVYKYTVGGTFLGSWVLDAFNSKPAGITIDPSGASQSIWIVDQGRDQVFRYDDAQGLFPGVRTADAVFDLAPDNIRPQGIALTRDASSTTAISQPVASDSPVAVSPVADATDLTDTGLTEIGEAGSVTVRQLSSAAWHTVELQRRYDNPVVVLSPASNDGGQPLTVRVRNVGSHSFQFQLDEWDYLDGAHVAETAGYLVVEAGRHELDDGTVVQAGTLAGVNHGWSRHSFADPFQSTPVLLTQTISVNDRAAVTTRSRQVTATGFRVRLQEQQGADGRHAKEGVAFIAVEQASGTTAGKHFEVGTTGDVVTHRWHGVRFGPSFEAAPVLLAAMQTFDGGDPGGLRYRNLNAAGVQLRVAEERSADREVRHTGENLGYILLEAGTIAARTPAPTVPIGEVGSVTIRQPDSETWHEVQLNRIYLNPVVVMSPPSFAGSQPLTVRVRHVWGDRFEFQLDEWEYLDGAHAAERVGYIVLEAGRHVLPDGTIVEADVVSAAEGAWRQLSFHEGFDAPPVVLTQVMSDRGVEAVVTRQRNVRASGFQLRLQEEQAADGSHPDERVGYVAIERGRGTTGEVRYEAGSTPNRVRHGWYVQDYGQAYAEQPVLLANAQTFYDGDPVSLRYAQTNGSGFQVRLQEEQSADREMKHGAETVDYAVFEPGIVQAATTRSFGSDLGETGFVQVAPANAARWLAVELDRSYLDPVVVLALASDSGGPAPAVHLRNVRADRFEFQVDEELPSAPAASPAAVAAVYVVFEEDRLRSLVADETAGDFSPAAVDLAIGRLLGS